MNGVSSLEGFKCIGLAVLKNVCIIRYLFGYFTRPIGVIKVLLVFKAHALLRNWNEVVLVIRSSPFSRLGF